MDDIDVWFDAYTAYLRHQLTYHAPQAGSQCPGLVIDVVERLWTPTEPPRWPHLIEGLRWAMSEHGHADEFAVAIELALKLEREHKAEQQKLADWEEPEPYQDNAYIRRHEEWERTRRLLHGDEDSTYFWDRYRWLNGG